MFRRSRVKCIFSAEHKLKTTNTQPERLTHCTEELDILKNRYLRILQTLFIRIQITQLLPEYLIN